MVLAYVCVLAMVTYLDRVCFGMVAPTLADELALDSVADLKWAFTSFAIAYAIFEIPTGWLGDSWGPRGVLLRIVVCWSVCTALTGVVGWRYGSVMVGGLGTLVALRFLFGAGEAGAFPNITRALHNWFPPHQAATAQGWVWMSGRLAGGLTPLAWTVLVAGTAWTPALLGWRGAFALFGAFGLLWCVGFAAWFRNRPEEHPRVNAAELAVIGPGRDTAATRGAAPWGALLRSGNLWLLCAMYFCMNYGWYFNITYLPSYLRQRYDLAPRSLLGALYQGGPLWMGAIGCLAGGVLVDWLIRRSGNRQKARRLLGTVTQSLCALCWLAALAAPNVHCFFLAVSLAALLNDLMLSSAWATCQDVGRRYAGVTAACMNTIGTLGAAAAGWFTGALVERALANATAPGAAELTAAQKQTAILAGYDLCFLSFAGVYALSALCWLFINSAKPIAPPAA
jgi:MFS family permease